MVNIRSRKCPEFLFDEFIGDTRHAAAQHAGCFTPRAGDPERLNFPGNFQP